MFSHYCAQVWDYQTVRLSNCRTLLRTQNLIDIPVHTGETERERERKSSADLHTHAIKV